MKKIRYLLVSLVAILLLGVAVHADSITFDKFKYGDKSITVRFRYNYDRRDKPYDSNANLEIHMGSKVCKKKVWLKSGNCKFTVPIQGVYKIGTSIRVNLSGKQFKGRGKRFSFTRTGKVTRPIIYYTWYGITSNSRKMEIDVENAHKGDIILVKIGDKGYWKTITTDHVKKKRYSVSINTSKAGTKVVVWMVNKYKQIIADKSSNKVWLGLNAGDIKVGMSKSQVLLIYEWDSPDQKSYTAYGETWSYDDNNDGAYDSFVYFDNKGLVTDWYY